MVCVHLMLLPVFDARVEEKGRGRERERDGENKTRLRSYRKIVFQAFPTTKNRGFVKLMGKPCKVGRFEYLS